MKKWTLKDVFMTAVFYIVLLLITQILLPFISRSTQIEAVTAIALVLIISTVLSIPFVYFIKTRGKRILIAELVLIICTLLLYIYSAKPSIFIPCSEAFGVRVWILRASNIGIISGSGLAYIAWRIKNKTLDTST